MSRYWPILVTVVAWSLGPIAIRAGLDRGFSPLTSSLVGTAVAVPFFLLMVRGAASPSRLGFAVLAPMVVAGLFGTGGTLFNYLAIGSTNVAVAVAVANTHPVFTALFSKLTRSEEALTRRTWCGIAFVVAGLVLVSIEGL